MLNHYKAGLGYKALATAVALASVSMASAQDQKPKASSHAIEEVVVSARRSEESIQSVPVSVTALDANTLRENSITTSEDLQMSTPGVFLSGSGGRQNVVFQIRGQSKALSGPSSPAVVSYFAEVPEPTFGSSIPQYDMSSVQVLKGPQGTLFGRNTTGGAVLFTPQAPTYEFGGYIGATMGNYDQERIQGAINIPIVDEKVALRIAGDMNRRDGYTENIGVGNDLDNVNTKGFRASLLVDFTDKIRNTLIVDHFKSENDGASSILYNSDPGAFLLSALGIGASTTEQVALQDARGPFKTDSAVASYENNERLSIVNRTEVDLDAFQIINIFGYRHTDLNYLINVDGMPGIDSTVYGMPIQFIKGNLFNETEQYSNELQFKGKALEDALEWTVGLFWLKSEPNGHQANWVAFGYPYLVAPPSPSGYNFITEESQAVFTNLRYNFTDTVQLEIGVRYTEDDVDSCVGVGPSSQSGNLSDCESGVNDPSKVYNTGKVSATSDATTYNIGLNWQVTDDIFAYAVTRKGYRAGGVNAPGFSGRLTQVQTFDPETVTDYEVGVRADWMIGEVALRTNVSAFLGEYKDVQAVLTGVQTRSFPACEAGDTSPAITPDGDCDGANDPAGGTLLVNAGESEVSGIDFEMIVQPIDALSINIGASYLDPDTKKFSVPSDIQPYVGSEEIPFNFTADKTFLAGVRYEIAAGDFAENVVFNIDYYWTDDLQRGDYMLDSYEVTNARIDANNVGSSGVDLSVFARNLFDEEYLATAVAGSVNTIGIETGIYGPPRMYGVEVRYNF